MTNNYSGTVCPKCDSTTFELAEDVPNGSNWKYQYLRCSECRTFLQALPMNNTNILIEQLAEEMRKKGLI